MSIDVKTEVVINRSKDDVARFAMNPGNDPSWIGGIVEARTLTDPPFNKGTKVARVATFLGKRIKYVTEVIDYEPTGRLVMHSVKGPFPMTIRYQFEETGGGTLVRIQNQGEVRGFFKLAGPVVAGLLKRSVTRDLAKLKELLEAGVDQQR